MVSKDKVSTMLGQLVPIQAALITEIKEQNIDLNDMDNPVIKMYRSSHELAESISKALFAEEIKLTDRRAGTTQFVSLGSFVKLINIISPIETQV